MEKVAKYIVVIFIAFFTICTTNAQILLGGSVDLNRHGQSTITDGKKNAGSSVFSDFKIKFDIGYHINEKATIGVIFSWHRTDYIERTRMSNDIEKIAYKENSYINMFGAGLSVRYEFYKTRHLTFFYDLRLAASLGATMYDKKYDALQGENVSDISLAHARLSVESYPGVSYQFNNHFFVNVYFKMLKIGYFYHISSSSRSFVGNGFTYHQFDFFNTDDGILGFGIEYRFE